MSTPSVQQGRSDIPIFSNKQPEAQRITDPRQCIIGGVKMNVNKKSHGVVDQSHSPGPFLCPQPLNINRLAAN